jgi:RNA polymerase sigma-70 factor (ECF subfamily)
MDFFDFDDAYVRRLRDGDRETVDHFYGYFRELLYRVAYRTLHSREQTDDAVQTVFLRAWSRLGDLREGSKLGAFMRGFCNYVVLEFNRGGKPTDPIDDNLIYIGPDQYEQFRIAQLRVVVREILAELEKDSPGDAKVLRAVFLDDVDKDELCRRLNVTRKNLRVILHRAKKKFRAAMKRLDGK